MKRTKKTPDAAAPVDLLRFVPPAVAKILDGQGSIPQLARDQKLTGLLESSLRNVPTKHDLYRQDARKLDFLKAGSVHLVLTSPPYWTLKKYRDSKGQLGHVADYQVFLDELDRVWHHCYRALVPGGRMVIVVGDVCLSRRQNRGRHTVVPLHSSIQDRCRKIGFDNLAPIIWHKIANVAHEVENGSSFLGKPYEPNAIIKNDIEYILMQRKPGGYRSPSTTTRVLSVISAENHQKWFRQIWSNIGGTSTRNHPAPYPAELAERLIRMFSFVGDTVLDPFLGTGTTTLAASCFGRNSIGIEIDFSVLHRYRKITSPYGDARRSRAVVSVGHRHAQSQDWGTLGNDEAASASDRKRRVSAILDLSDVIDEVATKSKTDSGRLAPLANYAKEQFAHYGLPDVCGGSGGELVVEGLGRRKAWDVAYRFSGKFRLLVSLKSMWKNASGTVPNRLDDLMGEAANVQQLAPELVIGYILVFDTVADSVRKDGTLWSAFFEEGVERLAVRGAPLWNQGLLEGSWFILINSTQPDGARLVNRPKALAEGAHFFRSLVKKLHQREPAIPFTQDVTLL